MNVQAGVLVSIDGPGGSGKSTVAAITAEMLIGRGLAVHETTEPSRTPLGKLIRAGTDEYTGMALACLVAGDRHHHLAAAASSGSPDRRAPNRACTATPRSAWPGRAGRYALLTSPREPHARPP